MSNLGLKEYPITIADRKFKLREMNGRRSDKIDELGDQATALRAKLNALAPDQTAEKAEIRAQIRGCDYDTYRVLLIPVDPKDPPDNEWLLDNMGTGMLESEIVPIQTVLNAHKDVLGNSIAQGVLGEAAPAAPSTGPVFAAR